MQQLTLNIALRDGFQFTSFYTNRSNVDVVNLLKLIAAQQEQGQFFFWGKAKTGKSHLLQACCQNASLAGIGISYLPLKLLSNYGVDCLKSLHTSELIVIDDVDSVLKQSEWEEALFHLINETRLRKQTLLISASNGPRHLGCNLPDLASRLLWGASYQIHELSDQDKFLALQLRARQRGFEIPDRVVDYLYKRYPRKLDTLMEILDHIDKKSLSTGRKITLPLIKEALESFKEQ